MIASTVSFARPLAVKQASVQPKKQRTVVMTVCENHDEASAPAVDRRRCVGDLQFHPLNIKALPQ